MITRVAACGLLCLISACSVTSPRRALAPWDHETAVDANTPTTTAATKPALASTPSSSSLFAQPQNYTKEVLFVKEHGDFMVAREPWKPDVQANVLFLSNAEVKGDPGEFNLQNSRFDIERRIHLPNPDAFVDVVVQYGNRTYEFSSGAVGANDETLQRASMTLTYGQFIDRDTLVELDFNPGIWSDFSSRTLHQQDWQFYGRGLVTWRYAKGIYFMGGVESSGIFRDVSVYPMLGMAYVIDEHWRFDMLLPRQIRMTYNESEHNSVFLSIDLDGGEYRIRAPTAVPPPSRTPRTVNVQEFLASIGGLHRFNSNLSVQGRIGMTMGGDYRFLGNGPTAYDGQLAPQLFVDIGFGWTF